MASSSSSSLLPTMRIKCTYAYDSTNLYNTFKSVIGLPHFPSFDGIFLSKKSIVIPDGLTGHVYLDTPKAIFQSCPKEKVMFHVPLRKGLDITIQYEDANGGLNNTRDINLIEISYFKFEVIYSNLNVRNRREVALGGKLKATYINCTDASSLPPSYAEAISK